MEIAFFVYRSLDHNGRFVGITSDGDLLFVFVKYRIPGEVVSMRLSGMALPGAALEMPRGVLWFSKKCKNAGV
jgi:hypothetical protein